MIRSKKITSAAKGEQCLINIAGVCNWNPETVVFCHFPDEMHGMGIKPPDVSGAFGCSSCHDAVDGRVACLEFWENSEWYMRRAQTRTMTRLIEMGVLKL